MTAAPGLPASPKGYRVDRSSGAVHSRYAEHAASLPRTKTEAGVRQLLEDQVPEPCIECFPASTPSPAKRQPARPSRARMVVDVTPLQPEPDEAPARESPDVEQDGDTIEDELADAEPDAAPVVDEGA
jgi:hypothetical protein